MSLAGMGIRVLGICRASIVSPLMASRHVCRARGKRKREMTISSYRNQHTSGLCFDTFSGPFRVDSYTKSQLSSLDTENVGDRGDDIAVLTVGDTGPSQSAVSDSFRIPNILSHR